MSRPSRSPQVPDQRRRAGWAAPAGIRLAATALLAAMAACSVPGTDGDTPARGSEGAPSDGDWLIVADTAEPTTLNCIRSGERPTRQICRLIADSLIDFDPDFAFVPRLAESFRVSPDGLSISFRLREGVRWHDGRPFSAADVLYTVDLIRRMDPEQEVFRTQFGPLAGVDAPDARTIRATYTEPYAGALDGWRDLFIMPAHRPFDPAGPAPLDREPIGTGPFRFVRWDAQERILLTANDDYFAGRPHLDRYVYRIIPTLDGIRAALETGDVDVAGLSTDWIRENPGPDPERPFRVLTYPTSLIELIYWNIDEPRGLFRDARVRRAMTLLLDRKGYVEKVHHGVFREVTTLIDPMLWGGDPELRPHPYDPDAAAALLDAAGIVDRDGDGIRDTATGPMRFTLLYTTSAPGMREVGSLLQQAAARAGVGVELQGLEWSAMRPRLYGHRFEAAIHRWRLDPRPDPYAFFHSSQIETGLNLGAYRSAAFDRLAAEARRSLDPDRTSRLLVKIQRILHEDQPCTFVAIPGAVLAIHKRFHTPPITAAGYWNWYPSILEWWVPPGERKYR